MHRWVPLGLLALTFAVSRIAYAVGGERFDAGGLLWYSLQLFFLPAGKLTVCARGAAARLCDAEHLVIGGQLRGWKPSTIIHIQPGAARHAPGMANISWLAVISYAATLAAGAVLLWRCIRHRRPGPRAVAVGLISLTVAWVIVFANLFELGENGRFRFETDPIVWAASLALLGVAIRTARRSAPPREV